MLLFVFFVYLLPSEMVNKDEYITLMAIFR